MKPFALTLAIFASVAMSALADDKLANIPKEKEGRWGVYSFDEAKEEAAKKKQPIVIMVVDHRVDETSVEEANKRTFWSLQKGATMVVIPSNLMAGAKPRLTEVAYSTINSAELGKGSPRLIVTTADGTAVIGQMGSEKLMSADESSLKDFGKAMDEANKNPPKPGTVAGAPAASEAGNVMVKNPTSQGWTNTDGRTIQAAVVEIGADKVVFQMPSGQRVDYQLANLDADSQKKVAELKAANAQ